MCAFDSIPPEPCNIVSLVPVLLICLSIGSISFLVLERHSSEVSLHPKHLSSHFSLSLLYKSLHSPFTHCNLVFMPMKLIFKITKNHIITNPVASLLDLFTFNSVGYPLLLTFSPVPSTLSPDPVPTSICRLLRPDFFPKPKT